MGIDRIGKGGAPPAPDMQGPGAVAPKGGAEKAFEVEKPSHAGGAEQASATEATNAGSPLARLRAGEIDVHQYVDLKVEDATQKLTGLSSAELEDIKSVLRDQLRTDPGLADLVRTATGKMPSPPEE